MAANSRPMRPKPKTPSFLPCRVTPMSCVGAQPSHCPARTMRSPSPARRAAINISVKAHSAVAKESTSGVLVTAMPRARAASIATWSKPTLKVAITFTLSGKALMAAAFIASPAAHRMPSAPQALARAAISAPSRPQSASPVFSLASNTSVSRASMASGNLRVTRMTGLAIGVFCSASLNGPHHGPAWPVLPEGG